MALLPMVMISSCVPDESLGCIKTVNNQNVLMKSSFIEPFLFRNEKFCWPMSERFQWAKHVSLMQKISFWLNMTIPFCHVFVTVNKVLFLWLLELDSQHKMITTLFFQLCRKPNNYLFWIAPFLQFLNIFTDCIN